MIKATSANKMKGCILYQHGLGTYVFRVYDANHNFKDYDIHHCDLFITIDDVDAYLYEKEDGRLVLDHSPETLGLK